MKKTFSQTGLISVPFLVFCCVGVANTLVDFFVYSLGIWGGVSPYFARVAAMAVSCLFSFCGNKAWTFKAADKGAAPLMRFVAVSLCTLCLGLFLLFVFKKTGFGDTAAYLLSLPFTLTSNYFGYKAWVFREKR